MQVTAEYTTPVEGNGHETAVAPLTLLQTRIHGTEGAQSVGKQPAKAGRHN